LVVEKCRLDYYREAVMNSSGLMVRASMGLRTLKELRRKHDVRYD